MFSHAANPGPVDLGYERQEREWRRWLESALELAGVGLCIVEVRNEAPRTVLLTELFSRLTGAEYEPGVRRVPWLSEGDSDEVLRLREAFNARRSRAELVECRREGADTGRPCLMRVEPLRDRLGRIHHMCLVVSDATAQRDREREQAEHERLALCGRLAAGAVHDLNNFLTVMMGFAENTLDVLQAGEDAVAAGGIQDLGEVLRAGEHAAQLTRRVLALARQPVEPTAVTFELGSSLVAARRGLEQACGASVSVEVSPGPGRLFVHLDPVALAQALLNLAVNARDAMPDGGRFVLVASHPLEASGPLAAGHYVRLQVKDTGVGMSREVVARAFEPLFTTKPVGSGTGLGLHSVRAFAQRWGGQARLESAPGCGTVVTLELPLRVDVACADGADGQPALVGLPTRGGRCVVVESEPVVRRAMQRVLAFAGFEVTCLSTAGEALLMLEQGVPGLDLLVHDGAQQGARGAALLARVRELSPGLPVLVTSATGDVDAAVHAAGAEVLLKPFSGEALVRRARAAMQTARLETPPSTPASTPRPSPAPRAVEGQEAESAAINGQLYFRPIVLTRDGSTHAFEVVATGGATGRPLRAAIAAALDAEPGHTEPVFVTLHPAELRSGIFLEDGPFVRHARRLVLLVREADCEAVHSTMALARDIGFHLAIGDLGTSVQALDAALGIHPAYARLAPALTERLGASPVRQEFVSSLVALLRRHGVAALARGVTRPNELSLLADRGCELVQAT